MWLKIHDPKRVVPPGVVGMSDYSESDEHLSTLYHTLRTTRRRCAIRIVADDDDPVLSVRYIARRISAYENEVPIRRATGEPYRNAYNALSQTHLPTLAEADIIIYDPKRQRVCAGPNLTVAALLIAINSPTVSTLYRQQTDDVDDSDGTPSNHRLSK